MKLKDLLTKRLGPLSLGGWLGTCIAIIAAGVIRSYVWPEKTNGQYLRELIETGTVQKTATVYVATIKKANTAPMPTEAEWVQIEKGLAECLVKQANNFLASGDPYLSVRADKTTPPFLAKRFLAACGATESDMSADSGFNEKGGDPQRMQPPASRFQADPAAQVPPSADELKKAAKPEARFLEIQGDVGTTTFDLTTVEIIQPGRLSVISTTIDYPWMMKFELKAFGTLGTYCTRPAGKYPAPADLLTLGPADLPVESITVQGNPRNKTVFWNYPYKRLAKRGFLRPCEEQDQLAQQQEITNGSRTKNLFDCRRGLSGSYFDEIDHGDPSKVLTYVVRPNSVGEDYYLRACYAVMHEWPYLAERPPSAQVDLGRAFQFGGEGGKNQDYAEAAKWYRKAAEQGDAKGQSQLAFLYDLGQGVQRDYAEAAKWYRLAADQGDGYAQLSLGIKYYSGNGVTQDYVQAYKWFTLALARFPASGGIDAMMHDNCVKWRDKVAAMMTPAQIAEAQRLSSGGKSN
jgi:TPR repeat protein